MIPALANDITPARHLITSAEFTRMGEAGVFQPDDRLELIEGEIVDMSPIGRRHAACVRRLVNLLTRLVGDEAVVDVQNPVAVSDISQPEPDLALYKYRCDFYADEHPRPEDVLLLVEVSETSLKYDREVRVPLFALAKVPEVWIVDLKGNAVEVYRDPTPDGYAKVERFEDAQLTLSPATLPRLKLTVAAILGQK